MPAGTQILLVEDNPADQWLALEALKTSRHALRADIVENGAEALDYLTHSGKYAETPLPSLVLLDLNLPGMDGREVLRRIRENPQIQSLPVIVLTNSGAREDIEKCYSLHVNSYVRKPIDIDEFFDVIAAIEEYWFDVAELPA